MKRARGELANVSYAFVLRSVFKREIIKTLICITIICAVLHKHKPSGGLTSFPSVDCYRLDSLEEMSRRTTVMVVSSHWHDLLLSDKVTGHHLKQVTVRHNKDGKGPKIGRFIISVIIDQWLSDSGQVYSDNHSRKVIWPTNKGWLVKLQEDNVHSIELFDVELLNILHIIR